MNNESSLTPTIIIFIVIIAIVGGYIYMKGSGSTTQPLTTSNIASSTTSQFQNITNQLSSISFDTNLFSDPRFAALRDINTPVGQEAVGRTDPFAPF